MAASRLLSYETSRNDADLIGMSNLKSADVIWFLRAAMVGLDIKTSHHTFAASRRRN